MVVTIWGGSETRGAAKMTDFADATGLCSWLVWQSGKIHQAGISYVGKQQPCQTCCDPSTSGGGQSRTTSGKKIQQW